MKINDLDVIFFENPISRYYINFLKNIKFSKKIIIISKYNYFKKIYNIKNFIYKNNFPILFLKKKSNDYFISFVEDYFNLGKNFVRESYNFSNLCDFNTVYVNSNSINSLEFISYLGDQKNLNLLYTGKELIKNKVLKLENNFFHFHPGYLPEMRGADISLRSVFYKDNIGCSLFKINNMIDKGDIILREKSFVNKSDFKLLGKLNTDEFYNFWYSFIDPSIRLNLLKKTFQNKTNLFDVSLTHKLEANNYYTFLSKKEIFDIHKYLSSNSLFK